MKERGGYCEELGISWQYIWPDSIKTALAAAGKRRDAALRSSNATESVLHSNGFEFAAIVINVYFMIRTCKERGLKHPAVRMLSDNSSSVAWTNISKVPTLSMAPLARILGLLLNSSDMHTKCGHIPGIHNDLADFLSRPSRQQNGIPLNLRTLHDKLTQLYVPTWLESMVVSSILRNVFVSPQVLWDQIN
jgi:hypothetical protein